MSLKTNTSFTSASFYRTTQTDSSQEHIMMQDQTTSPDQKLTARTLSWKRDQTTEAQPGESAVVDGQSGQNGSIAPEEKKKHNWVEPTAKAGIIAIVKSSWLNVLLVFIPIGIAAHFMTEEGHWTATIPFIFNFIAIIPLAKLLGFATEDLSLRVGEVYTIMLLKCISKMSPLKNLSVR
jgi:Ca2+:H+ antiporter